MDSWCRWDSSVFQFLEMINTNTETHTRAKILCLPPMEFVLIHLFLLCPSYPNVSPCIHQCLLSISAEWRHPVIKFNSKVVGTSEVVVKPGTSLDLQCEGDGPVNWLTRLPKHRRFVSKSPGNIRTIKVERPTAEFTGTYKCFYSAGSQHRHLTSSIHVYVKGELWQVLQTSRQSILYAWVDFWDAFLDFLWL